MLNEIELCSGVLGALPLGEGVMEDRAAGCNQGETSPCNY